MVGERLTSRNRLARMLMAQEQAAGPVRSHSQGLAKILRAGLAGYNQAMDAREQHAAQQAMMRGISAKPWIDPDTGKQVGQAGGLAGGIAAMQGMPDNPHAARMGSQLQMQKLIQDQGLRDYENRLKLKQKYPTVSQVTPTAPMQNYAKRNELVKQFGEDSPQVAQFDLYVRPPKWIDTGSRHVMPTPTGKEGPSIEKDISPEKTPEFLKSVEKAKAEGRSDVEISMGAAKKAKGAREMISVLDGVNDLIDQASGGGVEAIGDTVAGFFNISTEGSKGIAKLKIIESKLMENVPRMEGPQSDRDVEMYKAAAGNLGNPYTPTEDKKAAVEMIVTLNRKYAHLNDGSDKPTQIKGDEDYNKLPSGAQYIGPDGVLRRKP